MGCPRGPRRRRGRGCISCVPGPRRLAKEPVLAQAAQTRQGRARRSRCQAARDARGTHRRWDGGVLGPYVAAPRQRANAAPAAAGRRGKMPGLFQRPARAGFPRTRVAQAAQKGPDARRRAKGRVRRTPGTPQRARERANAADGPFSAACRESRGARATGGHPAAHAARAPWAGVACTTGPRACQSGRKSVWRSRRPRGMIGEEPAGGRPR